MPRIQFSIWLLTACLAMPGCGGDPQPTATEPQAATQMAKTDEQKMEYLIQMLHRENSLKKNAQAARELGRMGAIAEPAIPELRKAIADTPDDRVRADAKAAIDQIEQSTSTL